MCGPTTNHFPIPNSDTEFLPAIPLDQPEDLDDHDRRINKQWLARTEFQWNYKRLNFTNPTNEPASAPAEHLKPISVFKSGLDMYILRLKDLSAQPQQPIPKPTFLIPLAPKL